MLLVLLRPVLLMLFILLMLFVLLMFFILPFMVLLLHGRRNMGVMVWVPMRVLLRRYAGETGEAQREHHSTDNCGLESHTKLLSSSNYH